MLSLSFSNVNILERNTMKTEYVYAVCVHIDNSKELCKTYNTTHEVWMPAIFHNNEDAKDFYEEIRNLKGHEPYEYIIERAKLVKE